MRRQTESVPREEKLDCPTRGYLRCDGFAPKTFFVQILFGACGHGAISNTTYANIESREHALTRGHAEQAHPLPATDSGGE